jgi:hypothetical protein
VTKPRPTDSGLPRRTPGRALDDENPIVPHSHLDIDDGREHRHRMGQIRHSHDEDGRPVFHADAKLVPPAPDSQFGMVADGDYRPVPEGLGFVPPPDEAEAADPPAAPSASGEALEPSGVASAGSGGGSGRPFAEMNVAKAMGEAIVDHVQRRHEGPPASGRSIGRVIANTAIDAALGVPVSVQDERAHAREAVEILVEVTAEYHAGNQLMPIAKLLDLEAIVLHMVTARGVGR